jgi:tRNA pseudouridine 55 synthase
VMNGIINIYKENGFTSHDVVAKLRGILKQRKIGHTGTLDPDATGVLPICIGKGTKLCDFLTDKEKTYKAVMLLGKETDTQDISGVVLAENEVSCNEESVIKVIKSFLGEYEQIPPMYSAIKQNGKKLYELAREGKEVERKPRNVNIISIDIEKIELPRVEFTVSCSKGTYIRTLCYDIGKMLGCGACMEALVRTKSGSFKIENSLRLDEIETFRDEGRLEEIIVPIDEVFTMYEKAVVSDRFEMLLNNGNVLIKEHFTEIKESKEPIRVYNSNGDFAAIYQVNEDKIYKPIKMFLGG